MSICDKARQGKRLMNQLITEGNLELAALVGLMYQTPICIADLTRMKKSNLKGNAVWTVAKKTGKPYVDICGHAYRVTKELRNLLLSINCETDMIFTKSEAIYRKELKKYGLPFPLHEFRHEFIFYEYIRHRSKRRHKSRLTMIDVYLHEK